MTFTLGKNTNAVYRSVGLRCGSVIKHLPSVCKVLGSIPSTGKHTHTQICKVSMTHIPPFLLPPLLSQWALFSQHVFCMAQLNVHLDYGLVSLS